MMQLIFSEFQDQLVRGLAHRMNNILSLFHGYLGLLMDDQKLNPVIKEGLTRVRDGACDASELMERINAVTRPASTLPREMEPADLFRQLGVGQAAITLKLEQDSPVDIVELIVG